MTFQVRYGTYGLYRKFCYISILFRGHAHPGSMARAENRAEVCRSSSRHPLILIIIVTEKKPSEMSCLAPLEENKHVSVIPHLSPSDHCVTSSTWSSGRGREREKKRHYSSIKKAPRQRTV